MKRFTLLVTAMAFGALALTHLSAADDECVNVETVLTNIDAATDADQHVTVEFANAFIPVLEAETALLTALGLKDLATLAEAEARRMGDPSTLTVEDIEKTVQVSSAGQDEMAKKMEEAQELSDEDKVHLRNSCRPLIEGVIRTFRLGKAIVGQVDQLQTQLKTTQDALKQKQQELESAGRLQKVRIARDVDALAKTVAELTGNVNLAVGIAEVLPGYLEKFGGNYAKLAQFFSDNGIEMPADATSLI